jgi:hypothetical protein
MLQRLARFWSRWFWAVCVHSFTHTYGQPTYRICTLCRCVSVDRRIGWRLLRRKDRSLVYWYGEHGPSGEPFGQAAPLGPVNAGGWGVVERNERKIAEALS